VTVTLPPVMTSFPPDVRMFAAKALVARLDAKAMVIASLTAARVCLTVTETNRRREAVFTAATHICLFLVIVFVLFAGMRRLQPDFDLLGEIASATSGDHGHGLALD
jgi:hypothetical protein